MEVSPALVTRLRAAAAETEQARRLAPELVQAMAEAGIFRMCVPRTLGGGEVEPATMLAVLETLAAADGAAGWCAMIGATSGVVSAYLSDEAAQEIYERADLVTGGVYAPQGRAVAVDGGYRLTGRWAFASGCEHCAWLMGGAVIAADGTPPAARLMLFPARDARILDTWTVSGLRGTGSHDIAVDDVFVPAGYTVSLTTDRPRHTGPLYAFPVFGLLALGIAAVAVGIARQAIDELTRLAAGKTPTGSRRVLAERAAVQAAVAEAEATLRAARAFLYDAVGEAWTAAQGAGEIAVGHRIGLRLAATYATTSAARVVDLMYNAGGGSVIYAASPLQRHFRDIHVVTQHMMVAPATYELAGRLLLGLPTDVATL
jgi:alkylation response protein AidB-like acyl-CoA dehydrogenase